MLPLFGWLEAGVSPHIVLPLFISFRSHRHVFVIQFLPLRVQCLNNISVGFQSQHISSGLDDFGCRPGIFVLRLPATSIRIFVLLRSAHRARSSIASHTYHLLGPRLIYAGVCLQDIRYQSLSNTRLHFYVTGNPRIVLKCSQKIQASPMGRFAMHAALAVVAGLRVTKATRMT